MGFALEGREGEEVHGAAMRRDERHAKMKYGKNLMLDGNDA